jgi:hypothetical protein
MKIRGFRRSRPFRISAVIAASLLAMTIITPAAQATYVGNGLFESRAHRGQCLDSNGSQVYMGACDSNNVWQHWVVNTTGSRPNGYDQANIRHQVTGRFLASYYYQTSSPIFAGERIDVQPWNGSAKLYFDGVGPSWSDVLLQAKTNESNGTYCIDSDHAYMGSPCSSAVPTEHWDFSG